MRVGGRTGLGFALAIGAALCGCGGGGSGGGGGNTGGTGGSSGACSVNSTFQGQPGTLWVLRKGDGQLTVSPVVTIESNPGPIPLMTDGQGLYVFDAGKETLYEIDATTAATKRKLEMGIPASGDQTFIDNALVAAGAIWLGRNCGGKIYNRRVDIASWTIADFEFKQAQGQAPQGYAYLAP